MILNIEDLINYSSKLAKTLEYPYLLVTILYGADMTAVHLMFRVYQLRNIVN